MRSFSINCCASPLSTARFVPGLMARCTWASRADSVSRGSITIERGGSGPRKPVELVHPENRLCLAPVDADVEIVSQYSMSWTPLGCPSQPNVSFSDCPAVAVHRRVLPSRWFVPIPPRAIGPACSSPHEELSSRVETERSAAPSSRAARGSARRQIHRLVPARLAQFPVTAHERMEEPVLGIVRLPAVEPFGPSRPGLPGRRPGHAPRRSSRHELRCRARSRASRARRPTAPSGRPGRPRSHPRGPANRHPAGRRGAPRITDPVGHRRNRTSRRSTPQTALGATTRVGTAVT